jgi:hypothetical protein
MVSSQCIYSVLPSLSMGSLLSHLFRWIHLAKTKSTREKNRHNAITENTPVSKRESRRPRSRGHRPDDTTPSTNVYDFSTNSISNTQRLFEDRLDAASPPVVQYPVSTLSPSSSLDSNVDCTPQDFRLQWSNLPGGTVVKCKVDDSMPSLSDCHKHFQQRRFHMIASGVVGFKTRLYLLAQRQGYDHSQKMAHTPPKVKVIRCFCEVIFDSENKEMKVEVRCRDKSQVAFFVNALSLAKLI